MTATVRLLQIGHYDEYRVYNRGDDRYLGDVWIDADAMWFGWDVTANMGQLFTTRRAAVAWLVARAQREG
jgi:hypothetical protein